MTYDDVKSHIDNSLDRKGRFCINCYYPIRQKSNDFLEKLAKELNCELVIEKLELGSKRWFVRETK